MNHVRTILATATALLMAGLAWGQPGPQSPKFYAYCVEMGVPGVKPRPVADRAKLLRELGYDGVAELIWLDEAELAQNLKAIDEAGLKLYMLQVSLNVDPKKPAYDPRLPGVIRKLKGRPVTVAVTINGLKAGDPAGIEPATKALRELGDMAAESGVKISVYQHVNCWSESMPFIVDLVKKINHPQVGFNFNLCHWLKVHGDADYAPLLRDNASKIFAVNICGAQVGAKTWTNGLIQPLDQGDFDNRKLLQVLRQAGYDGPIGVMCYGVPGEPRDHLTRSLRALQSWTAASR